MMFLIETGLVLLALLLSFFLPEAGSRLISRIELIFHRISRRRATSILIVGLATLVLRTAMLPILPVPEPIVHDEFGYLLAADTFAHGRLTNETHPMWVHFETFSEIQRPSYQCYGPPAQGLLLAAGKIFFGRPYWAVWLSTGLMSAAITWMLQAWLPTRWALLGGVLAMLRLGIFGYWANSYWGGTLSAIAGSLVLGALPRIKRHQRIRDVTLMGIGLSVLANSRPYEGFILALPTSGALLVWMFGRNSVPLSRSLPRVALPLICLLAANALLMGYYFWRVTGDPLVSPYRVEEQTYAVAPYLLWQSPRPQPVYNHAVIQRMYVDQAFRSGYLLARSAGGVVMKTVWAWSFYLGPVLSLPMFMMAIVLPYGLTLTQITPRLRFLLLVALVGICGLALETFFHPHYASPFASLVLLLVLSSMRCLQRWRWRERPTGLFLVRSVSAICVVMFLLRTLAIPTHFHLTVGYTPSWDEVGMPGVGREELKAKLERLPERQLVIVNYSNTHSPFYEWVYNDANIDDSKIVWARGMGLEKDRELISYFCNRKTWLLEPDYSPPKLTPYPASAVPSQTPTF